MSYVDTLIEMNNEKRKLLSPSNLKAYEKVLMYLRCEWRLQNEATEEILNDLLDHLLEAQGQGVTTEAFFGDDCLQFSKDIVAELPKEKNRNLMMFFLSVTLYPLGIIFVVNGISDLISSFMGIQRPVNIGGFVIGFVLMIISFFLFLGCVLKDVQKESFSKARSLSSKIGLFMIYWICCSFIFALYILPIIFLKVGPQIIVSGYLSIILGIIIFLIGRMLFKKFS